MSFNLDIDIKDALRELEQLPSEVNASVNKEIKQTAFAISREAIKSISTRPSAGRIYKRGDRTHQASKAGDAPNSDTGQLVISIKAKKQPKIGGLDSYLVGSPLDYAFWLEFGTLNIAARPWLSPAVDAVEPDHVKRITEAVRKITNA